VFSSWDVGAILTGWQRYLGYAFAVLVRLGEVEELANIIDVFVKVNQKHGMFPVR